MRVDTRAGRKRIQIARSAETRTADATLAPRARPRPSPRPSKTRGGSRGGHNREVQCSWHQAVRVANVIPGGVPQTAAHLPVRSCLASRRAVVLLDRGLTYSKIAPSQS